MDGTDIVSHGDSLANMRRTFGHFLIEVAEFQNAAVASNGDAMDRVRFLAHTHIDAYFDAMHSAFLIANQIARNSTR